MLLKVYSIRDAKGEVYNTPFFQKTHGEAERSFKQVSNDEKTFIFQYPEDYDLYYLGQFDDQTGVFEPLATPQHMLKAVAVRAQAQVTPQVVKESVSALRQ